MNKRFNDVDIAAAVAEFSTYMSPRIIESSGKNGAVTVYGENANKRKPTLVPLDDIEIAENTELENGLLQEFGDSDFRDE